MADYKPWGPHSAAAHWAAWLAMKHAEGDAHEAKAVYDMLMPEEPIGKWKAVAERCWSKVDPDQRALGDTPVGRHPKIPDELALKIGHVYAQRLVWEHGKSRPFHSMAEVCSKSARRPTAPRRRCHVGPALPPATC